MFLDCGISCISTHILHDRNIAFSSNANPNYKFVFSPFRVFYFMNEILKQSTDSRKSTLQKSREVSRDLNKRQKDCFWKQRTHYR